MTLRYQSKLFGAVSFLFLCMIARGDVFEFTGSLSGPGESPANTSPGTGFADVLYDNQAHSLEVKVTFSGLLGTTTASHIHAATATPLTGTAGVATQVPTFTGFPLGVTSGSYHHPLHVSLASSFNTSFV